MKAVAEKCHQIELIRNAADIIPECEGPDPDYLLISGTPTIKYSHSPESTPLIAAAFGRNGWTRVLGYGQGFDYVKTLPNGAAVKIVDAEAMPASGSDVDPSVFGPEATLPEHFETSGQPV